MVALRTGSVSNAVVRDLCGLDTLAASRELTELRDRGLFEARGKGSATACVLPSYLRPAPQELPPIEPTGTTDWGELGPDWGELPDELRVAVQELGTRPRKAKLRATIVRLCSEHPWRAADLARLVGVAEPQKLVERHLAPLCDQRLLERRFPDKPNHPQQAYRAVVAATGAKES